MISVVIPAYNEEKNIGKCLDALVAQITSHKFEIIVADNNSSDKTVEIAKRYKNKLNIKIVIQKIKGRGAARQKGFEHAQGDIILSTDADTITPPSWIENLSQALIKDDRAIAVTGTCKINDCNFFMNTIVNTFQPIIMRGYRLVYGHFWLSGFNFGINKKAYKKSGEFDPNLTALEDIDLSFRVSRIGKIKFIPDLPVIVSGRRYKNGLIKGSLSYVSTFISYYYFKNKNIDLSNIR